MNYVPYKYISCFSSNNILLNNYIQIPSQLLLYTTWPICSQIWDAEQPTNRWVNHRQCAQPADTKISPRMLKQLLLFDRWCSLTVESLCASLQHVDSRVWLLYMMWQSQNKEKVISILHSFVAIFFSFFTKGQALSKLSAYWPF